MYKQELEHLVSWTLLVFFLLLLPNDIGQVTFDVWPEVPVIAGIICHHYTNSSIRDYILLKTAE